MLVQSLLCAKHGKCVGSVNIPKYLHKYDCYCADSDKCSVPDIPSLINLYV